MKGIFVCRLSAGMFFPHRDACSHRYTRTYFNTQSETRGADGNRAYITLGTVVVDAQGQAEGNNLSQPTSVSRPWLRLQGWLKVTNRRGDAGNDSNVAFPSSNTSNFYNSSSSYIIILRNFDCQVRRIVLCYVKVLSLDTIATNRLYLWVT